MLDGSCHGVRRTKAGPGQAQNNVEMLMHRAWVTHHHCPLALEQSVMGGAGINGNPKKNKKNNQYKKTNDLKENKINNSRNLDAFTSDNRGSWLSPRTARVASSRDSLLATLCYRLPTLRNLKKGNP